MTSVLLVMLMSAGPPKVASPAWNVVDVQPALAAFYSEQLAEALRSEGLTVTTADDIATMLGAERQRELLGCSGSGNSCMAELANALGCDATLTVSLARLGSSFRGLAKLMSSRDGSVLSSVKIDASNEKDLSDKLEAAAKTLAAPLKVKRGEPIAGVTEPAGPAKRAPTGWWVPGAVGVVAVGVGAFVIYLAAGKFTDLNKAMTYSAGAQFASEGAPMQTAGWLVGSVGLAAIAASVAWLVFGSTEVQPQLSLAPGSLSLGVGGHF